MNVSAHSTRQNEAFTITDLLFVIIALALVALVVFPSFAGVQNKGGRLQCANNLRQIGQDSMIYAGENNGWLPVCNLGAYNGEGAKSNYLGQVTYTLYVYIGGTPGTQITTNEPPPANGEGYQNLGHLYQSGLAGNGSIFFCPAQLEWEQGYEPLLTLNANEVINSSYFYNPRMANAFNNNNLRRYQTTSQLEPHKLFAVDEIDPGGISGLVPATNAHARDHGWNVLFTDGSVQFVRLSQNNNYLYTLITQHLVGGENINSWEGYDQLFDILEQDH